MDYPSPRSRGAEDETALWGEYRPIRSHSSAIPGEDAPRKTGPIWGKGKGIRKNRKAPGLEKNGKGRGGKMGPLSG